MAILSKGAKLSYSSTSSGSYTDLTNLQEFPDLMVIPDGVDVTTLDDSMMHYIPGIADLGTLEFKFIYDNTQFDTLNALSSTQYWKVTLSDNATFTFSGKCAVSLNGAGVNEALTYTLGIYIDSDITVA